MPIRERRQHCSNCGRDLSAVIGLHPEKLIPGCEQCARIAGHALRQTAHVTVWQLEDLHEQYARALKRFINYGKVLGNGSEQCAFCDATARGASGLCNNHSTRFRDTRRRLAKLTRKIQEAKAQETPFASTTQGTSDGREGPGVDSFRLSRPSLCGV